MASSTSCVDRANLSQYTSSLVKDLLHTWTTRLGEDVYPTECVGVDLNLFVGTGVDDFDVAFGEGGFEEAGDGFGAFFCCVLAAVDHDADGLSRISWRTHVGGVVFCRC